MNFGVRLQVMSCHLLSLSFIKKLMKVKKKKKRMKGKCEDGDKSEDQLASGLLVLASSPIFSASDVCWD